MLEVDHVFIYLQNMFILESKHVYNNVITISSLEADCLPLATEVWWWANILCLKYVLKKTPIFKVMANILWYDMETHIVQHTCVVAVIFRL